MNWKTNARPMLISSIGILMLNQHFYHELRD